MGNTCICREHYNLYINGAFKSISDANPTLPLALALELAPPVAALALALALLDVTIYRRKKDQIEVSRSGEELERETQK